MTKTSADSSGVSGKGYVIGIAVASWNREITDSLLNGALEESQALDVDDVLVARVPGALELAIACQHLSSKCDGMVAIGAVIRGETDHYEIVSRESASGLTQVALETGKPVANAILTVTEFAHAEERSRPDSDNKGREAMASVVSTLQELDRLRES